MLTTDDSTASARPIDSRGSSEVGGNKGALRRVAQAIVAAGAHPREYDAAVYLVTAGMSLRGFEDRFPAEWTRATNLRARFGRSRRGRDALKTIDECAPELAAEQLGSLYQLLREPSVRAANAAAYAGEGKLAGSNLLLVTQFFTDTYLADWLTARTLEGLEHDRLVVSDPCVGGGVLLVVAYRRLLQFAQEATRSDVSDHLLTSVLRGYDLDPVMAAIARLALWVEASRLTRHTPPVPTRFSSGGHRILGSLDESALRPLVAKSGERLVFLTNPPFLGRRLMDDRLRAELRRRFPDSGNDLAAAFVGHLAANLRVGDRLGVVHQNSLLHLTTLEALRRRVLDACIVRDAADLGPSAFERLTGDKARATLSVLEAVEPEAGHHTAWPDPRIDLSRLPRADKVTTLRRDLALPKVAAIPGNSRASRVGPRTHPLRGLEAGHSTYASFAQPMQGSSTGDNARFVRYAWEVPSTDVDWIEASKGGGYAKWWGLRRYVVRWGRDGELLRRHPGAALRNPTQARRAHLVWSDTGTSGVNVRVRPSDAVFIASGPGILVTTGDPLAHAAVLNSRLVSAYLRRTNPKLSLTPGALARIPFPDAATQDARLVDLATRAIALQQQAEADRVDVLDWTGGPALPDGDDLLAFVDRRWRVAVQHEVERLAIEQEIEERVEELYEADEQVIAEVRELVGASATRLSGDVTSSAAELQIRYARLLGPTLRYRGGVRTMLGCDGPVEAMSQQLRVPAHQIAERMLAGDPDPALLTPFVDNLLHETVLKFMGFTADRTWTPCTKSLAEVRGYLTEAVGAVTFPLHNRGSDWWLQHRLVGLHSAAFRRHPVLHLHGDRLELRSLSR